MLTWLYFAILALFLSSRDDSAYPHSELLLEPATLSQAVAPMAADRRSFLILDARSRAKYDAAHIPGAVWIDHAAWAKEFGDGEDLPGWTKRLRAVGVDASQRVVIYDDVQAKDAARIWWILRYWGHEQVSLLNGGWLAWEREKRAIEKTANTPMPSNFEPKPAKQRLTTKQDLQRTLSQGKLQIIDARSEAEHCGIETLTNRRAGAIPGAILLEWAELIDQKTHRFKTANEIKALFKAAGIELDRPTATHCQSGGRAAVMAFGLELMGARDVSNYYKSWSEWGNADDTPIVKPMPKDK